MVEEARRLGVHGWVRNRRDGSVEAVVAGAPEAVDGLLAWAWRGPTAAAVASVDVRADAGVHTDAGDPTCGFAARPTA